MLSPRFFISNSSNNLEKDFFDVIKKIGKPSLIKKGKTIIRYDSHASFFFYIVTGVFKTSFTVDSKEYVIGFTFKGDVDCCPTSLLSGKPNNFGIEAISDAEVLICDIKDFQKACNEQEYLIFINSVLVNYLEIVENRMADSISLTAEERYRRLLQTQPEEVKQIPLKYIAAYLGITLERLSRIRKKIKV